MSTNTFAASLAALTRSMGLALGLALFSSTTVMAATGCESIASIPITWNIDYTTTIQDVFSNRCSNCHVDHAGSPSGDLDLDPEFSWDNLVNAPSNSQPGRFLVVPGQPLNSVLFEKLNCDLPDAGDRMPRARPPLAPAEQALIFDWIMLGAPFQPTDFIFFGGFEPRP
ncbi:hypothetical protein [Dokdonella sp.]|uniref:hypothetical protein n=1 Tax=Dokdonella sp. TaxID=2291710 RepID=UPI003C5DE50E